MPGMMDTVLNLGLNDTSVVTLAKTSGDERFAYDSYRRFIQMYSNVVLDVDSHNFEDILEHYKDGKGYTLDTDLKADDWREVIVEYKAKVEEATGKPFPQEPKDQLWGAIGAVFSSWMNARAITYRRLNNIPADWGTAVNVQAMVFGNMGETSATGVAFTRNPSTGENALYGEFLVNAQGEDVVAGIRTPQNITEVARKAAGSDKPSLETIMPEVFHQFVATTKLLGEALQRPAGHGVHRRARQALDAADPQRQAHGESGAQGGGGHGQRGRSSPARTRSCGSSQARSTSSCIRCSTRRPSPPRSRPGCRLRRARPAARSCSRPTTRKPQARPAARRSWCASKPRPEDIHGMHAAEGILTTRGGMTSHAAVVARGMGKPCVSGAGSIRIDYAKETMTAGGVTLKKGDILTIDGAAGEVMAGAVPMIKPEVTGEFGTLMGWADEVRRMKVRANAETPTDARTARSFGAEGIGLCRTEHMFFEGDRIVAMREMILSETEEGRRAALAKLLPMQRQDFAELFEIMSGLPVTIRLLDPPLHEFLPKTDAEIDEVSKGMGVPADKLRARAAELHEFNPMLGFRGIRLAVAYPEIAEMQARAIFLGAVDAGKKTGKPVTAEIMLPVIFGKQEFDLVKPIIVAAAEAVAKETGVTVPYHVGTMIELPRAALRAGEIAESAEFFSFGTNDLTQTTLGISRDDAGSFLGLYTAKNILPTDPFVSIDTVGVGELIKIAVERGKATRPDIKLGVCGEHGGDPASIAFCEEAHLDYVSCSPFRIPIARLAAAQAALDRKAHSTA